MGHVKSFKQIKLIEKVNKVKQDFEKEPPRCKNCIFIFNKRFFVKGKGFIKGKSACRIGKFEVKSFSICNKWKGFNNDTLEEG